MTKFNVGDKVRATQVITESGSMEYDLAAKMPNPKYVHAIGGDMGVVVHVDKVSGLPTVKFDRKRTATLVIEEEIAKL